MDRVRLAWPHRKLGQHGEPIWEETSAAIAWANTEEFPHYGADYIRNLQEIPDTAYVRRYENITIDPKTGLIFQQGRVLWGSTDTPSRERTPLFHKHLFKANKQLDEAIVLHHAWDNNYFHFFLIIAPKLFLADTHGIDSKVPVVVSRRLASQPFFQESVSLGLFGKREIVIQAHDQIISTRTAYAIRAHEYDLEASEWICDKLHAHPQNQTGKRLYIHRGNNVRRFRNQVELNQLLKRYQVEFFDPQQHSLRQQIDVIAGAELILGAHGAGLTNMMFRRRSPCRVIELLNPSWCGPHYYLMSKQRGYDYHWVLNKNESPDKQASVDADLDSVEKLLSRA